MIFAAFCAVIFVIGLLFDLTGKILHRLPRLLAIFAGILAIVVFAFILKWAALLLGVLFIFWLIKKMCLR